MSNQPETKLRIGLTTATIWKNGDFFTVDFTRSYKDADGNWKNTTSYGHADLLNLAKSAERAENWIARQQHASN